MIYKQYHVDGKCPLLQDRQLFASGLRNLLCCLIERRNDLRQIQPADMQINGGRRRGSVAQKQLNMVEARSRFNQVGGKAVS